MIFIRAFLIALIFSCTALIAGAQGAAKCTLTPEQMAHAPELKGLWPGMTVEQVRTVVPALEMGEQDGLGLSRTSFSPDFNPKINPAAFQGVRTISLDFLDGRLFSVWLGYNESFKWKSVEEMVKAVTDSLKLPGPWETKGRGQQLTCGHFQVTVTMVAGSPTLRVTDATARGLWEKRRTEKVEAEP